MSFKLFSTKNMATRECRLKAYLDDLETLAGDEIIEGQFVVNDGDNLFRLANLADSEYIAEAETPVFNVYQVWTGKKSTSTYNQWTGQSVTNTQRTDVTSIVSRYDSDGDGTVDTNSPAQVTGLYGQYIAETDRYTGTFGDDKMNAALTVVDGDLKEAGEGDPVIAYVDEIPGNTDSGLLRFRRI